MTFPWSPAAATGIGSLPGTDAREAARVVAGELPDLLHVPELPARGPGGDCIGRTGALLAPVSPDFGLETTADGWRIASGRGRLMRRAVSWAAEDLDALEEAAQDYAGPLKTQVVGPWTLAAGIELAGGERMLKDAGACRDLAGALAEAVRLHVADIGRRFPRAQVLVQVDEPGLNAVLQGTIGSASGLSRFPPVDPPVAQDALRAVLTAAPHAVSGVHCCAASPPIAVMTRAGARFVSVDLTLPGADEDALGEAWESGVGIWAGSVDPLAVPGRRSSDARVSAPVRELARRLGMHDAVHMASVVLTPTCGCAGAQWPQARAAYSACVRAGRVLREEDAGE